MTDYRYQIFVSSTYVDLKRQRRLIADAIQKKGCYAAGMELFPASDKGAWDHIDRVMRESDLYLLISAGRYGSQPIDADKSFTEREYELSLELAESRALRHAVLILDRDRGANYLDDFDPKDSDSYQKQQAFQERVTNDMQGGVAYFFDDASLIGETHAALDEFLRNAGPGWIRADKSPLHEELVSLEEQRRVLEIQLSEAEARIDSLQKVAALPTEVVELECKLAYQRLGHNPYKMKDIATVVWSDLFSAIGAALDSTLPMPLSALEEQIIREATKHFKKISNGWTLKKVDVVEDDVRRIRNHLVRNKWVHQIYREKTGVHFELTPLGREAFFENEAFPSLSGSDVISEQG